MGKFGATSDHSKPQQHTKSPRQTRINKKPLKVTYISNPVMVKANNPTEFRAIVQELTGKDSEIGTYDDDENTMSKTVKDLGHADAYVSCMYAQEDAGYTEQSAYSASLHVHGVDEEFFWKELSEGLMGFQSRCVSA